MNLVTIQIKELDPVDTKPGQIYTNGEGDKQQFFMVTKFEAHAQVDYKYNLLNLSNGSFYYNSKGEHNQIEFTVPRGFVLVEDKVTIQYMQPDDL